MSKHEDSSAPILNLRKPWENNKNSVWLASTVSLFRNLQKFKFPGKLETDRRKQVLSLISKEILSSKFLHNPQLIKGEETSPLEKEFLVEHFLSNLNLTQAHSGEGFIVDESGLFLASLNLQEHLLLELIDCNGEIENAWDKLVKIETEIGKNIPFSFSPKFGFLTADYNHCGTALMVSIFLQVPALIHTEKIDEYFENNLDESIAITGIQGDPSEIIGDVIVLQNNYTLGVNEENIMTTLSGITTKLIVQEKAARNEILQSKRADIKDKVSRAFGILMHSYQIEAIEALNALSLIKLGSEMGWIKGVETTTLNHLFFTCRRSHLLSQFPEKINQDEIIHKRSDYIHQTLKEMHLTI